MKPQLPGLLSDRQIKELCLTPTYIVTERVPNALNVAGNPVSSGHQLPTLRVYPTHATEEELLKQPRSRSQEEIGIVSWFRPTEQDLATYSKPMIEPFFPHQVKTRMVKQADALHGERKVEEKIVSYGLSSYGYDVTCGREFKIFTNVNSAIVDPKNFDPHSFVDVVTTDEKPYVIIPPNSFALARTKEYFRIPRNVLTVCLGKSTYARCGIIVNVTPFEPEWEGYVTLEFSNTTPLPAKIYADEGCAQVLFFRGSEPCEVSYKDRGGKYQGQAGLPVTPKV